MKFIPLSTVIKLSAAFSAFGMFLFITGICIGTNVGLIVLMAGLLVLAGDIIFMALFYRCPHCGRSLTIWYRNHYCPHCGTYMT